MCDFFYRLRYYRGHNVHSPFVYSLIRNVFMHRSKLKEKNGGLYTGLRSLGVKHKPAALLQNLHSYCNYPDFELITSETEHFFSSSLIILVYCNISSDAFGKALEYARSEKKTVVFLKPPRNKGIRPTDITDKCLRLSTRYFDIFFYDKNISPKHYKL